MFDTKHNSACAECNKPITITGDGTHPFLTTDEGGKYFCSEDCKSEYLPKTKTLLELLTETFKQMLMPSPQLAAQVFIRELSPNFVEITTNENRSKGVRKFRSQIAAGASLISCVLTGDKSFASHVGEDGIVHTPLRIGDFAHVISEAHPDALLREIQTVKFTKPIPLGAPVIITATKVETEETKRIPRLAAHSVVAHLETGEAICRPSVVTTTSVETKARNL